jgi:hypothetical protein
MRAVWIGGAASIAIGAALCLGAGNGRAASTVSAAATPRVYLANCDTVGFLEYRPKLWGAGCTAGSPEVYPARWTRWTASQARATGKSYVDNCTPDCAQPTHHADYPSTVVLTRPVRCTRGVRVKYFSRAVWTITYPKNNPFGEKPGKQTFTYPVLNNPHAGVRCVRQ